MRKDIVLSERTDRNGTRHQIIETNCVRCGGAGGHEMWRHTGTTCFKCGGSGRMNAKNKIYTPEHAEKLRLKREKANQKRIEEIKEKASETSKIRLSEWGYDKETIHMVLGDTYILKDQLKEEGANFGGRTLGWYFSEKPSKYPTAELDVSRLIWYNDLGQVFKKDIDDEETISYIKRIRIENEYQSHYIGEIGDKIEIELTFINSFWLESHNYFSSQCINKMKDEFGNIIIWKTGKSLGCETNENNKVRLKGTIKEHSEYREEQQTILTRCKSLEIEEQLNK